MKNIKIESIVHLQGSGDRGRVRDIVREVKSSGVWNERPIILIKGKKGKYILVDGWHRTEAAKKLGMKTINAKVAPKKDTWDWLESHVDSADMEGFDWVIDDAIKMGLL